MPTLANTPPGSPPSGWRVKPFVTPDVTPELKEAWGTWLDSLAPWEWFITITFRDPSDVSGAWTRPGWSYAKRAWREFAAFARPPIGQLSYVRCFEVQSGRMVPHIHALVGASNESRWAAWSDWLWTRYGMCRILPFNRNLGAQYYVTKYVSKALSDIEWSPNLGLASSAERVLRP